MPDFFMCVSLSSSYLNPAGFDHSFCQHWHSASLKTSQNCDKSVTEDF